MSGSSKHSFIEQVRLREVKVRLWSTVSRERCAAQRLVGGLQAEHKAQHTAYIQSHPEMTAMLNDFVTAVLLHKPEDVYAFAEEHFAVLGVAIGQSASG